MGKRLNIGANRRAKKYSLKEYCYRCLWSFGSVIFRVTPRPCFLLRRVILRVFGATIGKAVNIYPSTNIMFPWNLQVGDYSCLGERVQVYNLGNLKIGENSTISQNSHLCGGTHNYKDASMPLIKSRILIGNDVWICADSFIGPGVYVADFSIVAARSVVIKDVGKNHIVGGNPAKYIKMREQTFDYKKDISQ
jgi:putative colanic acid biosynthesis acetyltransferase WcaF